MKSSKTQIHKNLNLIYQKDAISASEKKEVIDYLSTLYPIWENRFSKSNPPPNNEPGMLSWFLYGTFK